MIYSDTKRKMTCEADTGDERCEVTFDLYPPGSIREFRAGARLAGWRHYDAKICALHTPTRIAANEQGGSDVTRTKWCDGRQGCSSSAAAEEASEEGRDGTAQA